MNEDARWTAVASRDHGAGSSFVYAVSSTGIYCRAGCPSRTPRRDRVTFFDRPSDARAAGFRACRRCRPDERPDGRSGDDRDAEAIARVRMACALIHAEPETSIAALTRTLRTSRRALQRDFRSLLGLSPREYRAACRLSSFKREAGPNRDLTAAILDAGYRSSARLYELSGALGMTPGTYRHGGAGQLVRYTLGDLDFGTVLVAATDQGICSVRFGDNHGELLTVLRQEFSAATLREAPEQLQPWLELVGAYLGGRTRLLELPIDVQGTAFQLKVWAALRTIPRGETRTYGELAEAIGVPGGARAVAQSCASNELPIAIPCHRVVPASGGAGGYRWGAERKRSLLDLEGAPAEE